MRLINTSLKRETLSTETDKEVLIILNRDLGSDCLSSTTSPFWLSLGFNRGDEGFSLYLMPAP